MTLYRKYSTTYELIFRQDKRLYDNYYENLPISYEITSFGAKIRRLYPPDRGSKALRDPVFIADPGRGVSDYSFDAGVDGGFCGYFSYFKYQKPYADIYEVSKSDPYNIQKKDDLGIVDLAEFVPSKYNPKINNLDGYWYEPVYPKVEVKGKGKARLKINGKTVVDIKYKDANGVIKSAKKE